MAPRSARLLVLLALALPSAWKDARRHPSARLASCAPEGRGEPPRHWLGCRADPGPRRGLADEERLLLGRPLDPNLAGARALAFVPGLSPRLARAVVADRAANGPFEDLQALDRVPGLGPGRLAQAGAVLEVSAPAPTTGPDAASTR